MGLSILLIGAVYLFVWRGNVGDWLVSLFQYGFRMRYGSALRLYNDVFRQNSTIIFVGATAVTFIVLLRFSLKRLTRYFDSINRGIDALVEGDAGDIALLPEMEAIEKKLNTVRLTLDRRARDVQLADRRKNDLILYLAHDIKTPLTSVIGYLSLLDEAPDMPAEQKAGYVRISLDKALRLEQLIDEFFEITRYNLGTIVLAKKKIDLYFMLAQLADEFYPQLAASGKRAAVRASENLTVYGDADKLARVFNNILKNAAAYGEAGSVVDIAAGLCGDAVRVTFRNAGSIPEDKLSSIFEKFFRLDDARSSDTGGAGLGLAIAKEIVVRHGGRIFAESDARRTTFTVELPALCEPAGEAASSAPAS
ncbi:MAG: HAMP domain-containing histidine kinase [Clostridiales Family XIII bacterium]|nr:HAMP domain-containing histidine kinase [Clostridiales Family XIII bacterium]